MVIVEEDHGIRVITLAGNSTGATFSDSHDEPWGCCPKVEDDVALGTYVDGNFQAISNSIMMNGSYSACDPVGPCKDLGCYRTQGKDGKKDRNKMEKIATESEQTYVEGCCDR